MGAAWEGLLICGLREGMGKGTREPAGWPSDLVQAIFTPGDLPNPGMSLGLLHCRQILYPLRHQGSPHQVLLAPGSAYISVPTCDLAVLSSFLQEFQCRLKRGGKKCETLGCPERGQLGLCSSQNILVPAAEAPLSVWLPVCPVVPQLQEVSGSCFWPGVMMPLRMKQKQDSDRTPCPRLCSSPCPS